MLREKKGLSPVIATVMLALLTVIAATIIAGVVYNLVKPGSEVSCFDAREALYFKKSLGESKTCTDTTKNEVNLIIGRTSDPKIDVIGFVVKFEGASSSKAYDVKGDENNDYVRVVGAPDNPDRIVEPGTEYTYVFTITDPDPKKVVKAYVAPRLKGNNNPCSYLEPIDIAPC